MRISGAAAARIGKLRSSRALPERTALRLALRESRLCLSWEKSPGGGMDFTLVRGGIRLVVDARTYLRLADYTLKYSDGSGFFLEPRASHAERKQFADKAVNKKERGL
jgi:Fe-S cluster assembly iron-binding protein IscA